MNNYDAAILSCVRTGVGERLTTEQLYAPLIDQIAMILAASQRTTGAKIDDLVEIVRHQLDQRVMFHVDQLRTR